MCLLHVVQNHHGDRLFKAFLYSPFSHHLITIEDSYIIPDHLRTSPDQPNHHGVHLFKALLNYSFSLFYRQRTFRLQIDEEEMNEVLSLSH